MAVTALYNELDAYPAQWIRNLIAAGHVAPGVVDERSIVDLSPDDVAGPGQRHFFAGLGGWSYALRLAGVPDDASIWTASCPCQPFSGAGRKRGFDDERHLWPVLFRLVEECRPPVLFGEQVASRDGLAWLDVVLSDLEREGYAVGAADLCAAGVGAPHIRQRLYFVAHADGPGSQGRVIHRHGADEGAARASGMAGDVADAARFRLVEGLDERETQGDGPRPSDDRWAVSDWLACADGRSRPVEPGTFPLVDGLPAGVGRDRTLRAPKLKGYGNAIVPQVAAAFIRAALGAGGIA